MSLYQHFREEEQPFIDRVLSWKEQVERTYQAKLTDFLNPREQQIIAMLIGTTVDDLQVESYGGGAYSERQRIIIAPFYEEIMNESFNLTLLQASYPDKFITLNHSDVMGSFLSLGIERKKLGDIFVTDGKIQIIMATEIAPYVMANLTAVKKAKITLSEKPLTNLMEKELIWMESDKTVSSLRLDSILKEIYNLSRKHAAEFVTKKLVKVNFKVVDDGKFTLQAGDLISLRGKGRSKIVRINGRTKKDKYKVTTAILK